MSVASYPEVSLGSRISHASSGLDYPVAPHVASCVQCTPNHMMQHVGQLDTRGSLGCARYVPATEKRLGMRLPFPIVFLGKLFTSSRKSEQPQPGLLNYSNGGNSNSD